MKIAEYKQMMEYLTRPGFNGGGSVRNKIILPKKKPEEEVKKRKIKNFEKAKPALENPKEVKEMIDKPKRGLVDEPGSYGGKGITVTEVNKYRKQGLTSKEIIKKLSESLDRNVTLTEYELFVTENKPKLVTVTKGKKITKERKKFLNKAAQKKGYKNYASVTDQYERDLIGTDATRREKGVFEGRGGIGPDKTPANDPTRFKEIKKFVNDTKKTFGYLPTKSEIKNYFEETKGTRYEAQVEHYVKKTKIKLPKGISGGPRANVDARIKKLLDNKTIIGILDKGKFPSNSIIKNILKVDPTTAGDAAFDLAKTLSGEKQIRLFNAPTKYKKIAEQYVAENRGNIFDPKKRPKKERGYYERGLTKLLNLPKNIALIRQDIVDKLKKIIPDMKNLSVDEIGSITTSMRSGSGPYAIFGQVIDKDFNTIKGSTIDASKGRLEKQLINLSKNDPERLRLKTNYNKKVKKFEFDANKNNPIKKVKGLKLSFRPPSETIKNKKVYNQYKDLFDAHYEKYGYSFEVPADRDSIVDISKKLDNKAFQSTVKNRFKTLLGKGGKFGTLVGIGTLAGTGYALADQIIPDKFQDTAAIGDGPIVPESASIGENVLKGTAATGAAASVKPGRDILKFLGGKALSGFNKLLYPFLAAEAPPIAFPVAAYKSGKLLGDLKRGEQTDSTAAGITSYLAAPRIAFDPRFGIDVFGAGANRAGIGGKFERFLRRTSPSLKNLTKLARGSVFATPFIETGIQGYNAYKALQEANKKASVFEPRVDTALGKAPISYYNKIMSELPEVDRSSAAGGGLLKQAGKSSGPPPESGPTPRGLDFLMKRGR